MLSDHRDLLISLFRQIKTIQRAPYDHASLCRSLQLVLIDHISAAEQWIRKAKQQVAELRRGLATPQAVRPTKDEAKRAKETIGSLHEGIEDAEYLVDVFRDVGDALAFIYIS